MQDPDELVALDLTDRERAVLGLGLIEWGSRGRCTEDLARVMGFGGIQDLLDRTDPILSDLVAARPMTGPDWNRILVATEIAFASNVLGSGLAWSATTGLDDAETLALVRSVQQKLGDGSGAPDVADPEPGATLEPGRDAAESGPDATTEEEAAPAPYTGIPALARLYLEDSYVLGLDTSDQDVMFEMDLVLTESHPDYRKPEPGEQHCFRLGRIRIRNADSVRWVRREMLEFVDANDEVDYGNIDSWAVHGRLNRISGYWGELEIEGGQVLVWLERED